MFNWKKYWILFLMLLYSSVVFAHDNNMIHPFSLTGKAWELIRDYPNQPEYKKIYEEFDTYFYDNIPPNGYDDGNGNYDRSKIEKEGTLGTIEEDIPVIQTVYHFYHAVTEDGLWIYANAIEYGKEYWKRAIDKYGENTEESKKEAYYCLGRYAHLLEDLSVPAHVHLDAHADLGGDDYEKWCEENIDDLAGGTEILPAEVSSLEDMMKQLAVITYNYGRFEGKLVTSGSFPESELQKMYPDLEYIYIDDPGYYFWRIPSIGAYNPNDMIASAWWICENFPGETEDYYYIENVDMNTPSPQYWKGASYNGGKRLCQLYADYLIPQSINFSAGLLKYFYDIVNEPAYVKKVNIKQEGNTCYDAFWDWEEGDTERALTPDVQEARNPKVVDKQVEAALEIEFSEPVEEVEVKIRSVTISGNLNAEEKKWLGFISI